VVLSTADFDSEVWTNKQHLSLGLANRGARVIYIESLGLRQPQFSGSDLRRLVSKLFAKAHPGEAAERPSNLEVVAPRVIPLHRHRFIRWINRAIMDGTIKRRLPSSYILWTFSPLTYGLETRAQAVIYHSVDLLHTLPRLPARVLQDAESRLLGRADEVIASSKGVASHLRALGRDGVLLWENVADTELFAGAITERGYQAIFAGNLTPSKVDVELLQELVEAGIPLVLAGPKGIDGTGDAQFDGLLLDSRVTYLGNLSLSELARQVGMSKVGLIPYRLNGYTGGVFPMKVFEYLSAGLSVVSTELPSLIGSEIPGLELATRITFVDEVRKALDGFDDREALNRQEFAMSRSWRERVDQAVNLLDRVSPERST